MTVEELKKVAKEMGYGIVKLNDYTCVCCREYPAEDKCVGSHEFLRKSPNGHFTYCKRR